MTNIPQSDPPSNFAVEHLPDGVAVYRDASGKVIMRSQSRPSFGLEAEARDRGISSGELAKAQANMKPAPAAFMRACASAHIREPHSFLPPPPKMMAKVRRVLRDRARKAAPGRLRAGRAPRRPSSARVKVVSPASVADPPPAEPPRPAALLCNQRTARDLFGWSSERFIAFVRRKGIRHAWDGRLCVCRTSDFLAALGLSDEPQQTAAEWSPANVVAALKSGAR